MREIPNPAALSALDQSTFTGTLGWIYEHAPWVAERSWHARPFTTLKSLHEAMSAAVRAASRELQLALIQAHPDLGARARMTDASTKEQTGAGLQQLTPDDYHRLQTLNAAYREKFGFPFIYAVKGSTPAAILAALEARLHSTPEAEFLTALEQIDRIAWYRLSETIPTQEPS